MEITACPKCGSKKIFHGTLRDGLLSGYTSKYVCKNCGFQGMPLSFNSEKEHAEFLKTFSKEDNSK